MPLPSPNLDDRTFDQLLQEAVRRVQQTSPDWGAELSPSDPGVVLLELFAHLTETMIYRLNRLPDKAYAAFLNLIGVRLNPPGAATATLRFRRAKGSEERIEIPRGTRVAASRSDGDSEPPVFTTARTVAMEPSQAEVEVLAHHCDLIEAELAGIGTGLPGLTLQAQRPPIVAPTGDEFDLLLGVEARPDELGEGTPVIEHGGKAYRLWREVDSFADLGRDRFAYLADRMAAKITFAPAARMGRREGGLEPVLGALAESPGPGREIRLWYRSGGGVEGNVAAGMLTVLKDPIPGVEVANPARAAGGEAAETLDNALLRGPQELHSLHRAVTARDYELLALQSSRAVARARALTRSTLWRHAAPGAVEVLLVPDVPPHERNEGRVTAGALRARQTEAVRDQIQGVLDGRRPLGTSCVASWARTKVVRASLRIVARREENLGAIRRRVVERLHQTINPLPGELSPEGWPFGQALRASHVYDMALAEPGVLWVDRVKLLVEDVPDRAVHAIAADAFQPRTWYAGSADTLYRSLDDGEGWEPAARFEEPIQVVRPCGDRAGLLAVVTELDDNQGSRVHISTDSGESWPDTPYTTSFEVHDAAWMERDGRPVLLLAAGVGLYELAMAPDSSPVQIAVDAGDPDRGFYAVAAARDLRGRVSVAAAAKSLGGVYLSTEGGASNTYRAAGLGGSDVRVLAVQVDGPRTFLWAGTWAMGEQAEGCYRRELVGADDAPDGWQHFERGWTGGSCYALGFRGAEVAAASHQAGVLLLNARRSDAAWRAPGVECGLPLRDQGRFRRVRTVAVDPRGEVMMAGIYPTDETVPGAVYRSRDGARYEHVSNHEFPDKVTLPPTWLFCSGEHAVEVVSQDEAERD